MNDFAADVVERIRARRRKREATMRFGMFVLASVVGFIGAVLYALLGPFWLLAVWGAVGLAITIHSVSAYR